MGDLFLLKGTEYGLSLFFCSVFQLRNISCNMKINSILDCVFNDLTPSKLVNFRRTCTTVRNMGVLKGFI